MDPPDNRCAQPKGKETGNGEFLPQHLYCTLSHPVSESHPCRLGDLASAVFPFSLGRRFETRQSLVGLVPAICAAASASESIWRARPEVRAVCNNSGMQSVEWDKNRTGACPDSLRRFPEFMRVDRSSPPGTGRRRQQTRKRPAPEPSPPRVRKAEGQAKQTSITRKRLTERFVLGKPDQDLAFEAGRYRSGSCSLRFCKVADREVEFVVALDVAEPYNLAVAPCQRVGLHWFARLGTGFVDAVGNVHLSHHSSHPVGPRASSVG